jgi:hypothetical protein
LIDTVHFVDKKNAPLLQISDACAFAMRRWLSGQSNGSEFARSVVEDYPLTAADWAGPMSCGLFYWHPQKRRQSKKGKIARAIDVLLGRSDQAFL